MIKPVICPHCHSALPHYKAGMKFHANTRNFGVKCNHCQQFIPLSRGGFRPWHYALIAGLSGVFGCVGEDIMGTYSHSTFTIFYICGFALLWLVMFFINSYRIRVKE